jgi:hypothetical protein
MLELPSTDQPPGERHAAGNPMWHLPPKALPMVFQGRTPAELAKQFKDPDQNGGRTLQQLLNHVSDDQLVIRSGWSPAEGCEKVPMPHKEFAAKMREWIEKGRGDSRVRGSSAAASPLPQPPSLFQPHAQSQLRL